MCIASKKRHKYYNECFNSNEVKENNKDIASIKTCVRNNDNKVKKYRM